METFLEWILKYKVTSAVSLLLLLAYAATQSGFLASSSIQFFSHLSLQATVYEPWKLFSPIFLHHNLHHLLVNIVAWLEFGSQFEENTSRRSFITLGILIAIVSNTSEFLFVNNQFGGFSGIVIALGSYIGLRVYLFKDPQWRFPPIYAIAIVGILVFDALGYENTSIYVHLTGAIMGGLLAFIYPKKGKEI